MTRSSALAVFVGGNEPFAATIENDWIVGPFRRPTNNSSHEAGTIHDDNTARQLGFRSGTIAGSIHFEQFLPLCEHVFGGAWERSGTMALYFVNPSIDREPVQAMIGCQEQVVGERRLRAVAMKSSAGLIILEGSATLGGIDADSKLRQRFKQACSARARDVRMLAGVPIGFEAHNMPTQIPQAEIDARVNIITERRPEFSDSGIHGRTVAPLSAAIHALRVFEDHLPIAAKTFIGMFGGIEWQYRNGPVFADYPYCVSGRVAAIGESPKTEMLWYECTLHDPAAKTDVARMLMLSRLLKATSPLWAGESKD